MYPEVITAADICDVETEYNSSVIVLHGYVDVDMGGREGKGNIGGEMIISFCYN